MSGKDEPPPGRPNNHYDDQTKPFVPRGTVFQGRTEELKGHIFDCVDSLRAADDMYSRTNKEIRGYVSRKVPQSREVVLAMENLKEPVVNEPVFPEGEDGEKPSQKDFYLWKKDVDQAIKRREQNNEATSVAYAIVHGQCTDALLAKIEAHKEYKAANENRNVISLLLIIKTEMFVFQTQKYAVIALGEAMKRFFALRQDQQTTTQAYLDSFTNAVEEIEYCGGSLGNDPCLFEKIEDSHVEKEQKIARDKFLAGLFLMGADPLRYGKLLDDLESNFSQGDNKYPKDLDEAYNRLINWKQSSYSRVVANATPAGAMFVQRDCHQERKEKSRFKCKNFEPKNQHSAPDSHNQDSDNDKKASDTQHLMVTNNDSDEDIVGDYLLYQGDKVLKDWILLDSKSTVNVFCNPILLTNIRDAGKTLRLKCNAGIVELTKMADLPGYPERVWFNPSGIANVLSLANVEEYFPVTYAKETGFLVYEPHGVIRQYQKSTKGLFYYDTTQ